MLKSYKLDSENRICMTVRPGAVGLEQFDFPEDFDFSRQNYYMITDGQLMEDTELIRLHLAEEIRSERDFLLSECDWTQTVDVPLSAEKKAQWAAYRQALRDVPQQENFPYSVSFPEKPQ